ncbi:hypothetical protein AUJ46_01105 [Candidatus Peregrinibacteria bacterium CG1_02_54_53]|nr:MAG: hypothetical protein AUJ46_01105 [Candidatus Peregrinibacteria bacterium CG1_02_54_53]
MRTALLLIIGLLPFTVFAAPPDVSQGAWYAHTVSAFTDAGYFPGNTAFRPGDNATRAEFIELIVKLQGGVTVASTGQSFDDVSPNAVYYAPFEQAAASGWMKGAGSCLGTHPCLAKPESPINRAEASAILQRAFGIGLQGEAPAFQDNPEGQWFTEAIRLAASNCILQGDAGTEKVRPSNNMNRAEMVVMLDRLKRGLVYPNCAAEGKAYQLPTAPAQRGTSAPSTSSKTSGTTYYRCTQYDWECEPVSLCIDGQQSVTCTLKNASCLFPDGTEPQSQTCSPDPLLLERMKGKIAAWDKLHERMVAQAQELARQENGSRCITILDEIEGRFIPLFNDYLAIYRAINPTEIPLTDYYWSEWSEQFDNTLNVQRDPWRFDYERIEHDVSEIEKEFRAAPAVCY